MAAGTSITYKMTKSGLPLHRLMPNPIKTREFLKRVGEQLRTETDMNFQRGGLEGEPKWPAHKPATIQSKVRRGLKPPYRKLVETGRLRQSITVKASRDSVSVGSNLIYARIHNLGGKAGRGHKTTIPQRQYLKIMEKTRDRMHAILSDVLRRG